MIIEILKHYFLVIVLITIAIFWSIVYCYRMSILQKTINNILKFVYFNIDYKRWYKISYQHYNQYILPCFVFNYVWGINFETCIQQHTLPVFVGAFKELMNNKKFFVSKNIDNKSQTILNKVIIP